MSNFGLVLAQSPAPEIRDIAPPVDFFPYPLWMVALAAILILSLLAIAIWLIVRQLRKRPAIPPLTPRQRALLELAEARGLIDKLDPYHFSIRVSDILRSFLTAEFQLRATRQTSPEFLASLSHHLRFTESEKQVLAAFLEKCDLIKFARANATRDDSAALLEQAVQFVEGKSA